MTGKYDDIINLPHHVSTARAQMSAIDRAAQFAPFAALTGYDSAVKETARLTDMRIELDDGEKYALNEKLVRINECLEAAPIVDITYFLPDEKKSGGAYVTARGTVKKTDKLECVVIMNDGKRIPVDDIVAIEGDVFNEL